MLRFAMQGASDTLRASLSRCVSPTVALVRRAVVVVSAAESSGHRTARSEVGPAQEQVSRGNHGC